jgi:hypothetical protein
VSQLPSTVVLVPYPPFGEILCLYFTTPFYDAFKRCFLQCEVFIPSTVASATQTFACSGLFAYGAGHVLSDQNRVVYQWDTWGL